MTITAEPTMRVVILDSFTTDHGGDPWDGVRAAGTVSIHPRTRPSEVVARCADTDAVLTNKVVLDAAAIAALPKLRYVGVMATGANIVDLDACRSRGIVVSNVPGYSTDSVAQLVFALLLHLTHDVAGHSTDAKGGRWAASPDFCFFRQPLRELAGETIAIVGSGAIGSAVARIAGGFGMRSIAALVPGSTSSGRRPLLEA
ncbi:MAG: hypothetical protein H0W83_07210, partial [Planctomycetes bacterium]|nr:hypothetical protein [Planctomycetota bacterium]